MNIYTATLILSILGLVNIILISWIVRKHNKDNEKEETLKNLFGLIESRAEMPHDAWGSFYVFKKQLNVYTTARHIKLKKRDKNKLNNEDQ